ncbi:MAG TPA: alpha/beta hydrolase [Clostridia bacterium]|nr:alpha/beta hydrolase [Clostridia bacterium]
MAQQAEKKSVFKSEEGKTAILSFYDKLLEGWSVQLKKHIVKSRHGDIFVLEAGDIEKPALILLHGSGSNSAVWAGEIKEYIEHFRVLAVDMPGEPGHSCQYRPDLNSAAPAEYLEDVFNAFEISQAAIIGMSLGGWTALKFATAFPEKVSRLILVSTSGIGPQKISFIFKAIFTLMLGRPVTESSLSNLSQGQKIDPVAVEYLSLIFKNFSPYTGKLPIFSDEELKKLNMPVMLTVGENDIMLDQRKTAHRLAALLPEARINLLPGTGHFIFEQQKRNIEFLTAC